jgi:hypothetical protein
MKSKTISLLATFCLSFSLISTQNMAYAQSEASALSAISALPIASVVVGATAVVGSAVAVPLVISTAGAVLVVKTVESTIKGTVYVLERASDGARVSVEIAGKAIAGAAFIVGASVIVNVVGAGAVLSIAGEAIAFIPNALGKALLHNERLTS